ncbi:phosphoribosylcarboxyaminoimidazole mutase [Staphylococcus gallinarum]|nr:phosphoribosylcarboxyaminoimidazole mutase [Staphylococcus gallinarum]
MLSIGNETIQKNLENYEKSLVEKVSEMQHDLQ